MGATLTDFIQPQVLEREGNMMESVDKMLMAKYGLHSRTTIWRAIKRVEARLNIS